MTKTYLTRDEAANFYGLDRDWFDLLLPSLDVRRIGDRMHRDDVAKLVARFDFENDDNELDDCLIEAANDNGDGATEVCPSSSEDGVGSGLSVTISSHFLGQ